MEYLRLVMSTLPASSAPRRVYFVSFLEGSSSATGDGSEVGRSRVRGIATVEDENFVLE
jgi:hypothetical protein